MERFMRESDAFSWYLEADPVLRSTVVIALLFDRAPDWDLFRARLERATRLVAELRARPVEVPARMAPPRWTDDPEFDLDWHLRRIAAPAGDGEKTVWDVAGKEASTGFDRSRPLWQLTVIEGLGDGRAALVMKFHHSITDGLGAVELAFTLFDHEARPVNGPPGRVPDPPSEVEPSTAGILACYTARRIRSALSAPARLGGQAVHAAVSSARDPIGSVRSTMAVTSSIGRTVRPLFETRSPIMKKRGLGRRIAYIECGLEELRAAATAAGGTVNDAFIAAGTGGLRLYHQRHGKRVETLRMMMPISLRTDDDPAGGNRITLIRTEVPVGQVNPRRRIEQTHLVARAARHERSLAYTNAIAGVLNLLPVTALISIFKHVDFVASDVPSFAEPVYLGGARLLRQVAFGPTTGSALNLTMVSYTGRCTIGVTIDTAAVPDPTVLVECLRSGLDEVLAIGRSPDGAPDQSDSGPDPVSYRRDRAAVDR